VIQDGSNQAIDRFSVGNTIEAIFDDAHRNAVGPVPPITLAGIDVAEIRAVRQALLTGQTHVLLVPPELIGARVTPSRPTLAALNHVVLYLPKFDVYDDPTNLNFPKNNQRYECNRRQADGVAIFYEPNPEFVGVDSVTVDVIFASGVSRKRHYAVEEVGSSDNERQCLRGRSGRHVAAQDNRFDQELPSTRGSKVWRKGSRPVAWLDGMVEILVSDNREG
jgi:hypothetical protein